MKATTIPRLMWTFSTDLAGIFRVRHHQIGAIMQKPIMQRRR